MYMRRTLAEGEEIWGDSDGGREGVTAGFSRVASGFLGHLFRFCRAVHSLVIFIYCLVSFSAWIVPPT